MEFNQSSIVRFTCTINCSHQTRRVVENKYTSFQTQEAKRKKAKTKMK